ncbi:protein kinase domain-containing protein [Prosthecobacter sp.]|uniref:protein kinase domain-containing protein n=1 Tax=Prosthecobacter sp. TaxID=1965333 RepID=UPI003783EC29
MSALPSPSPSSGSGPWQPPAPEELQALLPKYEVYSLIGCGGAGAVYHGHQRALERDVAIKILSPEVGTADPSFGERFRREALAMAKLNYAGIVAVYDFGQAEDGTRYIVMEYVDGTDLAQMLAKKGRLSSQEAMAITAHVCDALKYAHSRGIIHRDIKPANIMVSYDGMVKVADFGLARTAQGEQSSITESGMAMGTMHYIAPEALILGSTVDHRADIYAIGVMLYQMLTGNLPKGMFALPSHKVAGLDPRYDRIITRTMRSNPEERYQDVNGLRQDLDAILTKPVPQVDPNAAEAPAVLDASSRPQRPSQPAMPARAKAKGKLVFLFPVGGMVLALAAFLVWHHASQPVRVTIQRIEGEEMKETRVTGGISQVQSTTAFHAGVWSAEAHLWWHDGKLGDVLKTSFFVEEPGRQRVMGVLTGAADYGVVDIFLDGRRVQGAPFDMQADTMVTSDILDWGVFDLTAGDHTLEVRLVDTHGKVWLNHDVICFGLDYIQLEPTEVRSAPAVPGKDVAPLARPGCSFAHDNYARHMNDGREVAVPDSSNPQRMSWNPRKGAMEWAQLEWETPQSIHECQIVWSEGGISAMPLYWRLLYREESGAWVPVDATMPPAEKDQWCVVKFPAVKTRALRISAQCAERRTAGICHWKAIAADPAVTAAPPAPRHELSLADLSPLHAQVGWDVFRANYYGEINALEGRGVYVGGVACKQYLWAHPPSRVEFAIPAGYTSFTATGIGPSHLASGQPVTAYGSWTYIVEVDGKAVFNSNELRSYPGHEVPVSVALPAGSKRLTLITETAGDASSDHAFWAAPAFVAEGAPATTASTSQTAPPSK